MRFNLFAAKVLLLFHICKRATNFSVFNFKPNLRFKRIKYEIYTFIPFSKNTRLNPKEMRLRCWYHVRILLSLARGIVSFYKIIFFHNLSNLPFL